MITIGVWTMLIVIISISNYRNYHAKMHSIPTWGVVINNNDKVGRHRGSRIEYSIGTTKYQLSPHQPISKRYLGDSLIIYYDTTRIQEAFIPKRNPKDLETAFFMSERRIIPSRWERDYEKFQNNLEKERKAHRDRKHFYDYWCKDD